MNFEKHKCLQASAIMFPSKRNILLIALPIALFAIQNGDRVADTVRICATFCWKKWTNLEQRNRFGCKNFPRIAIGNYFNIFSLALRHNVALTATCDRTMGIHSSQQVFLGRFIFFILSDVDVINLD